MKRAAATLAALGLGLTVVGLRALLAPIRWAEALTADPPEPVVPLSWLPHEDDMDAWAELRVAPDPVVAKNGSRTKQEMG